MHETMIYHLISCLISCPSLPANHPTIYLKNMQILEDMWYAKAITSREERHDTYSEACGLRLCHWSGHDSGTGEYGRCVGGGEGVRRLCEHCL